MSCLTCQEDACDRYALCYCACHSYSNPTRDTAPSLIPCELCGMTGAHYCPGPRPERHRIIEQIEREADRDIFKLLDLPTCKKHRRYKAIRRPTTACEGCWRLWIAKNPE